MDDLEAILRAHGGTVESRGAFTLDSARFVQAMEDLNRAYPFAYLVKLLQFAFAGQPARLDVSLSAQRLVLSFVSRRSVHAHLEQAVGSRPVQADRLGRRPEHLRRAMALLMARPDLRLTVEEERTRLVVQEGDYGLDPVPSSLPLVGTKIELEPVQGHRLRSRPRVTFFDLLSPLVSRQWPEWTIAARFLAAPPCPVICNGEPVVRRRVPVMAREPALGRAAFIATIWATGRYGWGDLPREVPLGQEMHGSLVWEKETGNHGVLYLFRLARGEHGETPQLWQVVQDGFIIGNFRAPESLYPVEGWLDGSHLSTDASFLSAVRGSAWDTLVNEAETVGAEFLRYCAAEIDHVRPRLGYGIAFKRLRAGLRKWAASEAGQPGA